MLERLDTRRIVHPGDVPPTDERMKVVSAFNPGVIQAGDDILLLVRVAETPVQTREDAVGLPRWERGRIVIDWAARDTLTFLDPRVVEVKASGCVRLTFTSHLRLVRSRDGKTIDSVEATRFDPEGPYETFGVEDPRITCIDGVYYFTYVAVSPHGAATALASTTDWRSFERHGIIFPPENKDVVLFPEKLTGRYVALHRPHPRTYFSMPEMWLAYSDDLVHWGGHERFLGGDTAWSSGRIGAGTPPVRVDEGWLQIYHGNDKKIDSATADIGAYVGLALLTDAEDPTRILRHSSEPIIRPEADFETHGFVPNVVFPTAMVDRGGTWLLYYGAADESTGVVEYDKQALMASLVP